MTATTRLDVLDRSVEKANIWINEVAAELGTEDRHDAYRALRAFLHTLRDRLPVPEAAQLSSQLPLIIRGVYFEGWQPGHAPVVYRHPGEFLDRVAREARLHGETEASFAVEAAARVLRRHVSSGEMEDVARTLPVELRQLLTE
jgi:uncharacterized protein (DUF2267 family)